MPTQEEIAELILEEALKVSAELGEEAALIFLSGVSFGADLAMKFFKEDTVLDEESLLDLGYYYMHSKKGEIN